MTEATGAHGPLVGRINPFAIRGAGSGSSRQRTELITATELEVIRAAIRPEWEAMILMALRCGLRFGELTALRRSDIDLDRKVIRVRRAVGVAGQGGARYEKAPKSAAGIRHQRIPDAVAPAARSHLRTYFTGRDGLLFPGPQGGFLYSSVFNGAAQQTDNSGKLIRRARPGT
ncbi:tyrosine-type recombinase/integrase [Nocardioides sp. Iso805N]|uniref:tyrosine-type recombinase/integrase n=1 Tax=Nocardioides sp. Iso805N TaxID=1283287 RepID=UPI00035C41C1